MLYVPLLVTRQGARSYLDQRKVLSLPDTSGAHHGHLASIQTNTGSRRARIPGRPLLVTIRMAIAMRVLPRCARPCTCLVSVPAAPVLCTATASATLGIPRSIPVPRLAAPRGIYPTITGPRPTGAS